LLLGARRAVVGPRSLDERQRARHHADDEERRKRDRETPEAGRGPARRMELGLLPRSRRSEEVAFDRVDLRRVRAGNVECGPES